MSNVEFQAEIERFGRLYVASSHVSRAVMRSRSRDELLQESVRILVEAGKFAMALVSWHDAATQELLPLASYGDALGYSASIHMFADERPEGMGPGGTAFRSGKPYVCNEFFSDPLTVRWREAAIASGWRASAAFPVLVGDVPQGLLSVYSRESGFFGPDQVELLEAVVLDLAFGLDHLESEQRRLKTEAALEASQQRLKLAMDAGDLGTFDWDLPVTRIAWDAHHQRMFGFEPGTFDGSLEALRNCIHPADRLGLSPALRQARDSHAPFSLEFRILWPDGTEHWIVARGEFAYDQSGRACRMYGAVIDVTGAKRTEEALRESERRLHQALRVSRIGIFDQDYLSGPGYWSPQLRSIHGLGPDDPVSEEIYRNQIHPADRERVFAAIRRAHDPSGDGSFDVEHRIILPGGGSRWIRSSSQTFFAGEGEARRAVRTVGAVRDITERRQTEEQQRTLAMLAAMSRDFIGVASLEGSVVYLNKAAMSLMGVSSIEEVRRFSVFDFLGDEGRQKAREVFYPALLEAGFYSGELQFRHFHSGNLIDMEVTAFHILDEVGAPLYIATVARDTSEKKRAAAEKATLEEKLFQAQKMESIGRLAGGVAHDFNNLLTVINGYSQLILSRIGTDDPLHHTIEEIHKAGQRASGLTRQLLAFSRKQVLQPRVLDLNRVVREMRPLLERLVGEDVALSVKLGAPTATVHADPHQLEQVIMNLVVNARDAMPQGGEMQVESARVELDATDIRLDPHLHPGPYIMLSVRDTGEGMNEETRKRIFEPFFTTKGGSGTGLGLATVQGVVVQSGGYIDVITQQGAGTTFKVFLPALAEVPAEIAGPPPAPAPGGKETILVVEDLAEVRELAATVLRTYGYRVLQAASAEKAMLLCEQDKVHLVLTDVVMPNISGRVLANRLAELYPDIHVLFMSGYTGDMLSGLMDRGVHFIAKPFVPEDLVRKVCSILAKPAAVARVVIADDETAVRAYLSAVLRDAGYEVIEAGDGRQALHEVRSQHVDLVITDLVMPEQEGLETIQALRREVPDVGVIAVSGAFGGQFLKMAKLLGADAALDKPVSPERLLATVAKVLQRPR